MLGFFQFSLGFYNENMQQQEIRAVQICIAMCLLKT